MIGPNGAGKSTFNLLNGQLRADAGSVHLAGRNWAGHRQIWQRGVGAPFRSPRRFCPLTVENVQMALPSDRQLVVLAQGGRPPGRRAGALLEQVGMQSQADRPLRVLAYGDVKRVELAMAIASNLQLPWTTHRRR
jgi:branched-chain amino acid transport system ATP-binding protein